MTSAAHSHAPPSVSVIVPHYNDPDALQLCLASLEAQRDDVPDMEIVVCDNNSPLPPAFLASLIGDRARLVFEAEKGAGPARNRGVLAARGAILAFIDSDCIAAPGWLENGIAALRRGDIVGGRMRVFSNATRPSGADLFEQIFAFDQRSYVESKGFAVTANLFCRVATFEAVGGFANGVSEDFEWCRRAGRKGFTLVYEDAAEVSHPTRPDWPSLRHKWLRLTRETYQLQRMDGQSRTGWAIRQLAVAASALPHSARVLTADLTASEKLRALGALWRLRIWRATEGLKLAFSPDSQSA